MMKSRISFLSIALYFAYCGPVLSVQGEVAKNFRFPVGTEAGKGWIKNITGLQWLQEYDYKGDCGLVEHPGIDFNKEDGNDLGEPVYSVANGTIKSIGLNRGSWGNYILIEHNLPGGEKIFSFYAHLNSVESIDAPRNVKYGEIIGTVGKSGDENYTPHLHFELRKSSLADRPDWYFPCGESQQYVENNYYNPLVFLSNRQKLRITPSISRSILNVSISPVPLRPEKIVLGGKNKLQSSMDPDGFTITDFGSIPTKVREVPQDQA